MNDEDFARHAFAAAFRSGQTGEPPTLPDVELLAQHGRRANRNRHGLYAAGSTVLAGAAVAGIVTGPTLLGLGNPSPSGIGTTAQGPATTSPTPATSTSTQKVDPVKPMPGTPCATPPAIDWVAVVSGALPAGVTATAENSASCVQASDGSRDVQVSFKLSTGDVELQVNVGTGVIAGKLGTGPGTAPVVPQATESLDPGTLAQLQASKLAAVAAAGSGSAAGSGFATGSGSAAGAAPAKSSLDAAAVASLQAQKRALASAAATASPAPGATQATTDGGIGSCSAASPDVTTCVSHLTKGSIAIVEVQLMHTGSSPLTVDVMASNGRDDAATPAPGQLPSDATMQAIAAAVAAHF